MRKIDMFDPDTGVNISIFARPDNTDDFYLTSLHFEAISMLIDSIASVDAARLDCTSDMDHRERILWSIAKLALNHIDDY